MKIPSRFPSLTVSIGEASQNKKIMIDGFSRCTSPLDMLFEETLLSKGTCFFWQIDEKIYLVTNWHNLTGINPITGIHLSKTGGEPNNIKFDIWIDFSRKVRNSFKVFLQDENGPVWLQHPKYGRFVDVACVPLPAEIAENIFPINKEIQHNLQMTIADEVFVLGYPMSIGVERLPIWKRASVASEPQIDFEDLPKFLIDTATTKGMSGSPVIRRTPFGGLMDDGNFNLISGRTSRFIGVYSGRITGENTIEAQLGIVWKESVITEIINGEIRGAKELLNTIKYI